MIHAPRPQTFTQYSSTDSNFGKLCPASIELCKFGLKINFVWYLLLLYISRLRRANIKGFTREITMMVHCVQVQASGIPSPRYEWYYRPNEEVGAATSDEFQWTILQEKTENLPCFWASWIRIRIF
jgi:hypothetical protein